VNDQVVAQIRTTVPVYIGIILAALSRNAGFVIDEDTSTALTVGFTGLVVSAYYALVSWLSKKLPKMGWLLGYPKKPTYNGDDA
jgi:hypothetical protein